MHVRRDVRPATALLGPDGAVRLCGFGHAVLADDAEALRGFAGRTDRCSPEMACSAGAPWRHRPEFARWAAVDAQSHGRATDVGSLGVLAYELLTGRVPYGPGAESSAATQGVEGALAIMEEPLRVPAWVRSSSLRVTCAADAQHVCVRRVCVPRP